MPPIAASFMNLVSPELIFDIDFESDMLPDELMAPDWATRVGATARRPAKVAAMARRFVFFFMILSFFLDN
jgi:hypothetical protein